MGMTKVAFIVPGWPPEHFQNGVVTYAARLCPAMRARGLQPYIVTGRCVSGAAEPHVYIMDNQPTGLVERIASSILWRINSREWSIRVTGRRLLRGIRELHALGGLGLVEMEEAFGFASYVAPRSPVPIVVRLHGPYAVLNEWHGPGKNGKFATRKEREGRGIRAAAGVSAPSKAVLDGVRAEYEFELSEAVVIPNPVDPVPPQDRWSAARCDRRRILFVGRFDKLKGADLVVQAFARLLGQRPELELLIAGPDTHCTSLGSRYQSATDYLHDVLGPRTCAVTYLGAQPGSAVAELRQNCCMTVVASRYESAGYVVLEAMAQGCPLVASKAGGIPELVQHGRNGLLFEAGNANDLARKMGDLLANPELGARLGEQAARDADSRYNPDYIAGRMIEFYRSVRERCPQPLVEELKPVPLV